MGICKYLLHRYPYINTQPSFSGYILVTLSSFIRAELFLCSSFTGSYILFLNKCRDIRLKIIISFTPRIWIQKFLVEMIMSKKWISTFFNVYIIQRNLYIEFRTFEARRPNLTWMRIFRNIDRCFFFSSMLQITF